MKLHTLELTYNISSTIDDPLWNGLANLNSVYTYSPTYARIHKDYQRSSIPSIMVEASYENEGGGHIIWTNVAA